MKDFKSVAMDAAKAAGAVHKYYFEKGVDIKNKGRSFDLLTNADIESQEKAVSVIRASFPDHNIIAEEAKFEKTSSPYTWIIDPLDGTSNFASGLPIFAVSIALAHDEKVIAGVVYDVTREEMFWAVKGQGAFLNEKRIKVNHVDQMKDAILITGFYYDRGAGLDKNLDAVKRFMRVPVRDIRRLGAASLDICYVAAGRVPGYWEFELNPWDFAAGKLIVEEAGGKITDQFNNPVPLKNVFIVASNGLIHEQMLSILVE